MYAKIKCVPFLDQFHDTVFNPGHRHANRRGPPRAPKETEISASVSDGKNSKRGSASYGAHEVRLFCNFLFSHQLVKGVKGRPGAVVRAVSLSHQVAGSKQPLRRFCGGKACLGFSLPQTPLMWEPPALGLPPFLVGQGRTQTTQVQVLIEENLC